MLEQRPRSVAEELQRYEQYGAVLRRAEFYTDFAKEAARASEHGEVATMAMLIEIGEHSKAINDVFAGIPEEVYETVRKNVYIDSYAKHTGPHGRINAVDAILPHRLNEMMMTHAKYAGYLEKLKREKISVHELNPIQGPEVIFPMTGRSHLKGSYVDQRANTDDTEKNEHAPESVFYIQTGNIEPDLNDMFIKITGQDAERMIDVFREVTSAIPPDQDKLYTISDTLTVLYDSGQKGESTILDMAKWLVDGAKKGQTVRNISLFHPDALADSMNAAVTRGVDVRTITTGFPFAPDNLASIDTIMWAVGAGSRLKGLFNHDKFLDIPDQFNWAHAKLLLIGNELAFIGSHNLSQAGVDAGTQEWQVLIRDKQIVEALIQKFEDVATTAEAEKIKYLL
jgi:hypothetical protein